MFMYAKLVKRRIFHLKKIQQTLARCLSQLSLKSKEHDGFFLTTPIFYVNNSPHLGHFYTLCLADAVARYQKLIGTENILFSTGTDEYGLKIQKAAKAKGVEPSVLCDLISDIYRNLCNSADISYNDFIRTTEDRHKHVSQLFFEKLKSKDLIYKGEYQGWYSVPDESFLTALQVKETVLPSGEKQHVSVVGEHPVSWTNDTNYIFKMSKMHDDVLHWLRNDVKVIPEIFHNEALLLASEELPNLSISRSKSKVSWGIPIPGDDSQTMYVWFEALLNYLTVAGYPNTKIWPPNCQIIGKDILKFHLIYWPAMLLAAGLEPPRQIFVHSHWTSEGIKMSKSKGNVVCPFETINNLTNEGFRYYLLRTGVPHSDGNWCQENAVITINAELANCLGNLQRRCSGLNLNPKQEFPQLSQEFISNSSQTCKLLLKAIDNLPLKIEEHYSSYNFYKGIDEVMTMLRMANSFIQEEEPWKLKNSQERTKLDSILHIGLLSCQSAAIALQPIIPNLTKNMLDSLNVPIEFRSLKSINSMFCANAAPRKIVSNLQFFKRLTL